MVGHQHGQAVNPIQGDACGRVWSGDWEGVANKTRVVAHSMLGWVQCWWGRVYAGVMPVGSLAQALQPHGKWWTAKSRL